MNDNFWIVIKRDNNFYSVEKWEVGDDRILFVEKKKCLTLWGSKVYAKKVVLNYISKQYIKEKI